MEEDQNALALEADAAFERKHGFKPSERSFRAKPYLPNLKQIRAGDITEEYKRFGIKPLSRRISLNEWYSLTASQPSSAAPTRTSTAQSTPQLKGQAGQPQITGEPAGMLLLDNCQLCENLMTDLESATLVLHHLAELHPIDPFDTKAAQATRLLRIQDTVASCSSLLSSRGQSAKGSRVASMASSLVNSPQVPAHCTVTRLSSVALTDESNAAK